MRLSRTVRGDEVAKHQGVKVRIVRQPIGSLEEIPLRAFHLGEVYDIAPSVAEYLVAEGIAIVEMRDPDTRAPAATDRRRKLK